jgi:hypothetical protein
MRAAAELQGSALTPERRERVMRTARTLGVRPFDANLIVAIAQDHARRGEPIAAARPILSLLAHPDGPSPADGLPRAPAARAGRLVAASALAAAAALTWLLARWVAGG